MGTLVFSDALTNSDPSFHLISRYTDERTLDDIAREYRWGRAFCLSAQQISTRSGR